MSPNDHNDRGAAEPAPFHLGTATLNGRPTVVAVRDSRCVALADLVGDLDRPVPQQVHELFAAWDEWEPLILGDPAAFDAAPSIELPEAGDWLVPVNPVKVVCIGANYYDHLEEMGDGIPAPDFPYSFLKPPKAGFVAAGQPAVMPPGRQMVDWEAELALVIGTRLHRGRGPEVLDAVAGYTVYNDLSARDWIASTRPPGVDWVMMKAYDDFAPIGPFVTPARFVADPQDLAIRCWVNDELKQDSSTARMIFGVQAILEHLSDIMTLEPGDVVATGTPAGVGFGAKPQQFLQPGDRVAVEIDGLGRLETVMVGSPEGAVS